MAGSLCKAWIYVDSCTFVGDWQVGVWIIAIFVLVVVSTGNAVNISDGLDGLAGGSWQFHFRYLV
ncbi:hypothetical protein GWK75_01465 [Candidatus Saccharibacteria bacterium oral taxon 955]|nr:hypothetical protein GWK75_01465 [Candidatus Saccharibacteria bacterium oral taxon 955]